MTTSSSDSSRCTRISPSAVLDDRLDGKDLEWARDHLRRCEACRERVEDFREMLLRVGRLPKAVVGAAAMDQAFAAAIPERLRDERGSRTFEMIDEGRLVPPVPELAAPMYPEVTNIPDLMSELEREIFHDEPVQDHPTALTSMPPTPATHAEPSGAEDLDDWREVPIDSHREVDHEAPAVIPEPEPASWLREPEPEAQPEPVLEAEPALEPEPVAWVREPEPELQTEPASRSAEAIPVAESLPILWDEPQTAPAADAVDPVEHGNVIFDHEPALTFAEPAEETPARPPRKSDNAMRLAVGLGAAACVLLAAVLYEGSTFLKLGHNLSATAPTTKTSVHPSASTPRASISASATAPPTGTAPPAAVLYTFGDGVAGGSVFRIRPGTAVAGYTRLVFDMRGSGLPSMIITRPDDSHIQVFFKSTTVTGAPVGGIRSYLVAAVEPGVQQGADGSFLIDLAHPVRVTAFTLPATAGYAWRLVVDLHTS